MIPGRPWFVLVVGILAISLAACGADDAEKQPTPTVSPAATSNATVIGSIATDGICIVTIPDDWIDDGTGKGETVQGDDWILFGGNAKTDEEWASAKDLLKAQFDSEDGVTIDDSGDRVSITEPDGRGYYLRERFDTHYCEFSVTSPRDNSEDVTSTWMQVADTMAVPESD